MTVDGTDTHYFDDTRIFAGGVNRKKYSHKFHKPGITWLLGLATVNDNLVCMFGPKPAGLGNELSYYQSHEKPFLRQSETVLKNLGFVHDDSVVTGFDEGLSAIERTRRRILLAWHEGLNGRYKEFACIHTARVRHHDVAYYLNFFKAVAVIIQVKIRLDVWRPFQNVYMK